MSVQAIENTLNKSYEKILSYWNNTLSDTSSTSDGAEDSLERQDALFRMQLLKFSLKYPQTLNYSFDTLRTNHIDIATSADKLFRIYSWDTWQGGTMHDFENIFQYKSGDKVYAYSVYDTSDEQDTYVPFYSDIYTLKNNNKTYYLAIANGIYSTKDASQSIKIFDIENDHIHNVKLIKTPAHYTNEIEVYFDFFSVADRSDERPIRVIKYDSATQNIYIPVVTDDEKVTNKFIVYKFNGNYFEKQKGFFTGDAAFLAR
jgi:hypothetical protein